MNPTRRLSLLLTLGLLALVPTQSPAGTVRLYGSEDIPDPRVVATILSQGRWQPPPRGATRGLSAGPASAAEALPADAGQDVAEERINAGAQEAVAAWNERLGGKGATTLKPVQVARASERPALAAATLGAAAKTQAASEPKAPAAEAAPSPPVMPAAKPAQPRPAAGAPAANALALMVVFANNSAQLAPKAARALDAVAEGMKLAGFERRILIEGHTNATGKATHNMKLSQLRAEAVKRYLVAQHGIPERALVARGYGFENPLVRLDPYSARNRRVQFRTLDA